MKKILIISIVLITFITGCKKDDTKADPRVGKSIMQLEEYQNINLNDIDYVEYVRYTEGGRSDEKITDLDQIKGIYNNLNNITIGNETTMACEDNTTVYEFNMKDGNKINIEIECDWLVLGSRRYEISR